MNSTIKKKKTTNESKERRKRERRAKKELETTDLDVRTPLSVILI